MRRRLVLALASFVLVAAAVLTTGPAVPAGAASNGSWSVYPTTKPGTKARVVFSPTLTPGMTTGDSVTITNLSAATQSFDLYAADAFNTPGGGLSLRRQNDPVEGIGAWIHLGHSAVTVPPHTNVDIGFLIVVPPDATPGDHVGGIVAEQTVGTQSKHGNVPVTVIQAVGVRVLGRVQGPLTPKLTVAPPTLTVHSSTGTYFGGSADAVASVHVVNSGNVVLTPVAHLIVSDSFGTVAHRTIPIGPLLPGQSVTTHGAITGIEARGHLVTKVSVAAAGAHAVSATSSQWLIPWALVGLVLAVVLLVVFLVVRWWRRRRRRAAPPGRGRHRRGSGDSEGDPDSESSGSPEAGAHVRAEGIDDGSDAEEANAGDGDEGADERDGPREGTRA